MLSFAARVLAAAPLVLACAVAGCASASEEASDEAFIEAAPETTVRAPDVGVSEIAQSLGLVTVRGNDGRVVLEAVDGSRILLFPGTRVASVAGRTLELSQPVTASGTETWIAAGDAASIRTTWNAGFATRPGALPAPSAGGQRAPAAEPPAPRVPAPVPPEPRAPSASDNRPTPTELKAWSVSLKRRWQYIVIHHSASATGDAATIHQWHKDRGMDGLGYNFVIGNGTGSRDGAIEVGYRWRQQLVGAHAKTAGNFMNEHGIGVCLVGDFTRTRPTPAQLRSLDRLCTFLAQYCTIPAANLRLHGEVKSTECPGRYFPHDFAIRLSSASQRAAAVPAAPVVGTK